MIPRLKKFLNLNEIPQDVQRVTSTVSVYWFGFGFSESLISILIFTHTGSLMKAGLVSALGSLVFIGAIPMVGVWADKIRATSLLITGGILNIFVGMSYFLVGTTGLIMFLLLATFLDGIAYACNSVGRDIYIQRHSAKNKIATAFGYFETIGNLWWIVAGLFGIVLIQFLSITELLFLITPFSIIYALLAARLRHAEKLTATPRVTPIYNPLREIKTWNLSLKSIAFFNFIIAFTGTSVLFFLPIDVFMDEGNLVQVLLMGIASALPALTGWSLGRYFDARGYKVISTALFLLSAVLLSISFLTSFYWRILIMFIIGMLLELIYVGSTEIMTQSSTSEHLGRVNGIMASISAMGGMLGPILVGYFIDVTTLAGACISLATLIFALAILFHSFYKQGVWGRVPNVLTR